MADLAAHFASHLIQDIFPLKKRIAVLLFKLSRSLEIEKMIIHFIMTINVQLQPWTDNSRNPEQNRLPNSFELGETTREKVCKIIENEERP